MSLPEYAVHCGPDWSCANDTESFCVVPLGEYTVADTISSELGSDAASRGLPAECARARTRASTRTAAPG